MISALAADHHHGRAHQHHRDRQQNKGRDPIAGKQTKQHGDENHAGARCVNNRGAWQGAFDLEQFLQRRAERATRENRGYCLVALGLRCPLADGRRFGLRLRLRFLGRRVRHGGSFYSRSG